MQRPLRYNSNSRRATASLSRPRHARGYDPARHVTAGELRQLRFYLPEILHDDSFVRREAVGCDEAEVLDDGSATIGLNVVETFEPECFLV